MPLRTRLDREKKKSGLTFETVQQDQRLPPEAGTAV